uniref:Tetraspanin 2 n=1 Tax=Sinocyclocheilus grahami TaxID=75366 RepID=A0A672RLA8_SINGR
MSVCVLVSCAGVYILIAAGGLVMLVGFFGCCGAVRESQCLLGLFFTCLLVIFGAEVAAGVFGFLNKDKCGVCVQYALKLNCLGRCGIEMHIINQSVINLFDSMQTCHEAIAEFFNSKLFIVGYVGIGIAGVMVNTIMSLTDGSSSVLKWSY